MSQTFSSTLWLLKPGEKFGEEAEQEAYYSEENITDMQGLE